MKQTTFLRHKDPVEPDHWKTDGGTSCGKTEEGAGGVRPVVTGPGK